jgi:hypothetical protein
VSKIAIIAGLGKTCFFNAETVYRAALQAEAETVFAMYKTASGKALEYTKLAEARALKEATAAPARPWTRPGRPTSWPKRITGDGNGLYKENRQNVWD